MRFTLLGVGAMNSPRYAPAGLLVEYGRCRVAFDGGPGAEPPWGLDSWLVCDEHGELRAELRRIARTSDMAEPTAARFTHGRLTVEPLEVAHTSHPTYGYRITVGGRTAVWAPEFWEFPAWAAGCGLMFAEAASWARPIRFRGGVGGHMAGSEVAAAARDNDVGRLVFAHIGRPTLRVIDAGTRPAFGEWGVEGASYRL
jgi:hypothetical protein